MGAWFDAATDFFALRRAALRAARGCGRSADVAAFRCDLEAEVLSLQQALRAGVYWPGDFRSFAIRDPKPRTISAAPFRDRVVHHAWCAVALPQLERDADPDSFACRVGKGPLRAIHRAQELARRYPYFGKMDVLHCFETADLALAERLLVARFPDPPFLDVLRSVLTQGANAEGRGLPIGNLTSQHVANLLLGEVDREARRIGVRGWVRYLDDMLVFGDSAAQVERHLGRLNVFLEIALRQSEKASARRLGAVSAGVPFLGLRIWPGRKRLDRARRSRWFGLLRTAERQRAWEERELSIGAPGAWERERHAPQGAAARVLASIAWVAQADTRGLRRHAVAPSPANPG